MCPVPTVSVLHECRTVLHLHTPTHPPPCSKDDSEWTPPDREGRQEIEVVLGDDHISFTVRCWCRCLVCGLARHSAPRPLPFQCAKIGSLTEVQGSRDPEGMRTLYFLVQDLKCLVFSLISLHHKIRPI